MAVVPRLRIGPSALAPVPVAPGLAIWPRDAWAPGPPTGPLAAEEVRFLLVHHTAGDTDHRADQVPGILASMYAFHTGAKGWHDIAYNFLVDREGGVWEGRAGSLAGPVAADATGGSQGFDQLVCFIGDFTSVMPTPAAVDAGNRTLAWLAQRYSIATAAGSTVTFVSRGSNKWPAGAKVTTATVAGHREMSTTACPGNAFYPYVRNQMQAAVDAHRSGVLAAPASTVATTSPATTTPATAATTATTPATTTTQATTSTPAEPSTTTTAEPSTTTTAAPSTTRPTTTAAAATTAPASRAAGDAASAPEGSGTDIPVLPIGAAAVGVGAALVWLRRRAQRDEVEPPDADG